MVAKKRVSRKKVAAKSHSLSFENGLRWPWVHAKRQWNVLWLLLPILGWFALAGYFKRIYQRVGTGKLDGLPAFGNFGENLVQGFLLFVYLIPLALLILILRAVPIIGDLLSLFGWLFVFPYMVINVVVTGKFVASFDFERWWRVVIGNFGEYLIALLKSLGFGIIYGLLSLVLVGIPGSLFGKSLFIGDFYSRHK